MTQETNKSKKWYKHQITVLHVNKVARECTRYANENAIRRRYEYILIWCKDVISKWRQRYAILHNLYDRIMMFIPLVVKIIVVRRKA